LPKFPFQIESGSEAGEVAGTAKMMENKDIT